jgi:meso-butanediol dehydrogenase/(S,S)-butanediol dehydrogenase/diacetyl reductase
LMVFKSLEEHTTADWLKIFGVDLLGAFYFTREAFSKMKPGGAIVNVSSVHAVETTPLVASYAAAKAALLSLTRSSAIEGKSKGIRVNAVLPGAIETPMLRENPNIKAGLEVINQSDVGKPEDVAAAIAFLASDDARFVQGTSFRVDGGRLASL